MISRRFGAREHLDGGDAARGAPPSAGIWFVGAGDLAPPLCLLVVAGAAMGCGGVLGKALLADVIDLDEQRTGERKEGVYSAASTLVLKVGAALAIAASGPVMAVAGFVPNVEQSEAEPARHPDPVRGPAVRRVPDRRVAVPRLLPRRAGVASPLGSALRERVDWRHPFRKHSKPSRSRSSFAAQDDFARIERLPDLEKNVADAAARARTLFVPADVKQRFARIEAAFAKPLAAAGKRAAVERALAELAPLRDPGFADAAIARGLGEIPGVGPRRAQQLAQRGLRSIADLLFHLPSRYDDRRAQRRIADLEVGHARHVQRRGQGVRLRPAEGPQRTFSAVLGDESGVVTLKWFRGGESVSAHVKKGVRLRATGDVRRYRFSKEVIHPEIDLLRDDNDTAAAEGVVPEYPAPEGIPPRTFRRWVAVAVERYSDLVPSTLPAKLAAERRLPPTPEALRRIHRPEPDADPEPLRRRQTGAHERLVLEELYLLEVGLALRHAERAKEPGIALDPTRPGMAAARGRAAVPPHARAGARLARDRARTSPSRTR